MKDLIKKITDARLAIFIKDPFLGYVLQHHEILISEDVITACTDGKLIIFGRAFLEKLTHEETQFILLHEVLHIILGHVYRGRDLDHLRFNVACDIVINDIIKFYNYSHGNLRPQFGDEYGIRSFSMTAEEVYEQLPDTFFANTLDCHIIWLDVDEEGQEEYSKILSEILRKAGDKYEIKSRKLKRAVRGLAYSKKKHNWQEILKKYITKDIFDYSFSKTDYRYQDVLMPSFLENEEAIKNIWFLIDGSGSMSTDLVLMMLGEVERILRHFKSVSCDISFFSTETTIPQKFTNKEEILKIARNNMITGGTDFKQIYKRVELYYKYNKPKLMIICTDGFAEFPNVSDTYNIPTLWITNNDFLEVPFGKKVLVD